MNRLNIELKQDWETLDEAIGYFLDLVLDLKAAQHFPDPPADLYLVFNGAGVDMDKIDDLTVTLTNG